MKIVTVNEKYMTKEQKSKFRKTPTWNGECVNDYLKSHDYLVDLVYDDNDNLITIYDNTWTNLVTGETRQVHSLFEVPVLTWIPIERNDEDEDKKVELKKSL